MLYFILCLVTVHASHYTINTSRNQNICKNLLFCREAVIINNNQTISKAYLTSVDNESYPFLENFDPLFGILEFISSINQWHSNETCYWVSNIKNAKLYAEFFNASHDACDAFDLTMSARMSDFYDQLNRVDYIQRKKVIMLFSTAIALTIIISIPILCHILKGKVKIL